MQVRLRIGSRDCYRSSAYSCRRAQAIERDCRKISHQGSSLSMSLLVVGSVAFDAVESPYGKVDRALGGAATYFAVAASFFTHVNLVGIVGDDFTEIDAQIFRGRTIDVEGLERAAGKTFFWAGKYSQNLNERTPLVPDLNVFADFKPKLPEKYRHSKYVFLANIAPDLQRDVLKQVKGQPKLVALDTMNYWIEPTNP